MDMLGPTLVLYLLIGAGIAVALYLTPGQGRLVNIALAVPFWPLYLPILLAQPRASDLSSAASLPDDVMTAAIRQVDRELSALSFLEHAHAIRERLTWLRGSWLAQADRVRAMDRLLALPDYDGELTEPARGDGCLEIADVARDPNAARRANIERLRQVRHETFDDLMAKLARVRELVSRIYVAEFSGASPTSVQVMFELLTACGDTKRVEGEADAGIQTRLP
jgi:hypothetical protein